MDCDVVDIGVPDFVSISYTRFFFQIVESYAASVNEISKRVSQVNQTAGESVAVQL